MALLVDIGNSRLKWGVTNASGLVPGAPFVHRGKSLEDGLQAAWQGVHNPETVVVSNVSGNQVAAQLEAWVRRQWGANVHFLRSRREAFGVRNAYQDAEQLGADRWACLLAVRHFHRLPACIIDCGTAVTIDVIDGQGIHRGGLIAPGIRLMGDALRAGTSAIVETGGAACLVLGDSTGTAIHNGILGAVCGLVERTLRRLRSDLGIPVHVVFTGGDAGDIALSTTVDGVVVPDLVLQGLSVVADAL